MGHVVLVTSRLFVATSSQNVYIFITSSASKLCFETIFVLSSVPCAPGDCQSASKQACCAHAQGQDPQHSVQLNQWLLLRCSFWVYRLGVDLKVCVEVVLVTLWLLLCGSYLYNKVVEFSHVLVYE